MSFFTNHWARSFSYRMPPTNALLIVSTLKITFIKLAPLERDSLVAIKISSFIVCTMFPFSISVGSQLNKQLFLQHNRQSNWCTFLWTESPRGLLFLSSANFYAENVKCLRMENAWWLHVILAEIVNQDFYFLKKQYLTYTYTKCVCRF